MKAEEGYDLEVGRGSSGKEEFVFPEMGRLWGAAGAGRDGDFGLGHIPCKPPLRPPGVADAKTPST